MQKSSTAHESALRDVIVVGAGFAGLYALHSLRKEGFDVEIVEAGDDVGGTWYWNRYPGARCDVESLEYSYAFSADIQQAWTWSERFATQNEIHAYLRFVADRLELRRDIRFSSRVVATLFDEQAHVWTLTLDNGEQLRARYCIMATGCLSVARLPDIPGIAGFTGQLIHSTRWPQEDIDFSTMRVGVIGTGSTGIQIIPVLAERAGHLTVFQRTPSFSVPARNAPLPESRIADWKNGFEQLRAQARATRAGVLHEYGISPAAAMPDAARQAELERRWLKGGPNVMYAFNDVITNEDSNRIVADFIRGKIAETVADPDTARKLMPTSYPVGSKRICVDSNYYATYNRANVTLVDLRDDPIHAVDGDAVVTASGRHPLDALVLATGFDAITGALLAIDIRTSGGRSLQDAWRDGPKTYLGLGIAGIPNLFVITGPGSPCVFSNMVLSIEHDVEWITACLSRLRDRNATAIVATDTAQTEWMEQVSTAAARTLLAGANSWYRGANIPGKPQTFMPYVGGVNTYQAICKSIAEQGYAGFAIESATQSEDASS